MKLFNLIYLISIPLCLINCKDDPESPLKGCCGNQAINETVGNGHIYVPNIFTPNGDGVNDYLAISTDSIDLILNIEIRNEEGVKVFESNTVMINDPASSWNGEINGEAVEGLYSISINVLAEDGTSQILTGSVCNYPCDCVGGLESISTENCQFPVQATDGQFDPTLSNAEPECCFR